MFGPIYSPIDVVNTAVQSPESAIQKMVVNSTVEAVQKALEPPTQEEKEKAQQQEAKKQQEERDKQQQADEARRQADRLRLVLAGDETLTPAIGKAEALKAADHIEVNTGAGIDDVEVALAGKRQEVLSEIEKMKTGGDGKLNVNIDGLAGFAPEVPSYVLERAGVIKLSLDTRSPGLVTNPDNEEQSFMRGGAITPLSSDEMSVRVRLDFADGTVANTEMRFRKAAEDSATTDSASELASADKKADVIGRIGPNSKPLAAAA